MRSSEVEVMREKYLKGEFGNCPRVLCDRQHVLPIGTSEDLRMGFVKVFCPKCPPLRLLSCPRKHAHSYGC
eukprot:3449990-Amphidinium_carterae.1